MSTLTQRLTATDRTLASSVGADIFMSRAFAFLMQSAFQRPALGWVQTLLGGPGAARARVISLLGRQPVMLPGATVSPAQLPPLSLASVTSDKALYREGRDEVHLLALDPLAPGAEATLEITANSAEFGKHAVQLDARGAAAVTLRDLPAGEFEIRFRGAPKDSPGCGFTVAEYRLAPLVATLVDRRLDGAELRVQIRIESFGRPVEGRVQLELVERGARLAQISADARAGLCAAAFKLSGEGPHAINVQLAADPSRTATIPIVGSRAAERSQTTFSTLGAEVKGALLPSEGSRPVRGIYLEEGAFRTTPFRLDRIDATKARLTAVTRVETAKIVVIDPTCPSPRPGAVDPVTAPHPASVDERYRRAEALFQEGKIPEARAVFEEARATLSTPHPNYAYYIACCHARERDLPRAVSSLHAAMRDGWSDFELLCRDSDLASLKGYAPFEAIRAGGPREIDLDDVASGASIEVDVPEPMAVLAIGAVVSGEPWEGWAALITPAALAPSITVPERAVPGSEARIEIDTGRAGDDASVYLIVKDARLLTPDTPASRLAGGLKAFAEAASKELAVGRPTASLAAAMPRTRPPPGRPHLAWAAEGSSSVSLLDEIEDVPTTVAARYYSPAPPRAAAGPMPPDNLRAGAAGPGSAPPRAAAGPMLGAPPPLQQPSPSFAARPAPAPAAGMQPGAVANFSSAPPAPGAPGPYREAAPPPPSVEEPEVLFAGLVETRGGRAAVSLRLGPEFADYIVEAFAIAGADWAPVEARFRAEKETFASLSVPAFVHPSDTALARIHVGVKSGGLVRVTRDGVDVPLFLEGRPFASGEPIAAGRAELSFLAGPGLYEASIEDSTGEAVRIAERVNEPGKIRRLARSVRFLEPGQGLARDADPAIVSLRVLPGLQKPFRALVDATADYGHACCEQTAAKMLAACAMYALAEDQTRRDRAEAIILAGVRREASMWLRGRGFKMYPESAGQPDTYWGPKAARYLWNLSLLRDLKDQAAPGRALTGAVDEGLAMAADATQAYQLAWPPARLSSCEDAYAALRFGKANGDALAFLRQRTANDVIPVAPSPHFGGRVAMRTETAYGAAALLRAGGGQDRQRALGLTNAVVSELGPNGRLYSTVDSVAAIALMVELTAARVVGGSGEVEVDGERLTIANAVDREGEIRAIRALEGVAAVEVTRLVEEDWDTFRAGLQIAVSLNRGGASTRRLNALDPVELVVRNESGYKAGDLCWVCLPDALSRVIGGGQVKRFSVDFRGQDEVRIPLAATGVTVGPGGEEAPARFAVCVRNMFEEERGGSPGFLEVTVAAPGGGASLLDRTLGALRRMFKG
jgi:hypothetical protein